MRYAGETACAANRQVICMHWWDRLQPVNARLRAHCFHLLTPWDIIFRPSGSGAPYSFRIFIFLNHASLE